MRQSEEENIGQDMSKLCYKKSIMFTRYLALTRPIHDEVQAKELMKLLVLRSGIETKSPPMPLQYSVALSKNIF